MDERRKARISLSVDVGPGDRQIAESSIMLQRLATEIGTNVKMQAEEVEPEFPPLPYVMAADR